jgi:molybdate transport system ATP-binding protein
MVPDVPAKAGETLAVKVRLTRPSQRFALDVDFEAPPGVTVLFGPSGSGKSTTLAAIAGLALPADGRIALGKTAWFDGATRVEVPVHARRVAYVFQSLALFPHMTGAENVAYGMRGPQSRDARTARAATLLERLQVPHLAGRRPTTFSGGEAQRVAIARALATDPRVVLLDEPFTALDSDLREELIAEMRGFLRDLGVPVVFVTHDRREARALGDRLVVLREGKVRAAASLGALGVDGESGGAPGQRE